VKNPSIIVDLSHDNSVDPDSGLKNPLQQSRVLQGVLQSMKKDSRLTQDIKGFMLESFLKTGNQSISESTNREQIDPVGLSVTDECIGITETVSIIENLYNEL